MQIANNVQTDINTMDTQANMHSLSTALHLSCQVCENNFIFLPRALRSQFPGGQEAAQGSTATGYATFLIKSASYSGNIIIAG